MLYFGLVSDSSRLVSQGLFLSVLFSPVMVLKRIFAFVIARELPLSGRLMRLFLWVGHNVFSSWLLALWEVVGSKNSKQWFRVLSRARLLRTFVCVCCDGVL